tara:strand:- start:1730 stop:2869 length:1140 start_codon:yes stop_codon:yes gene_type:complete
MFRIFYAEKDAALYESVPTLNTGIDEILEVGKRINTSGDAYVRSRSLLKFDMSEIQSTLTKYSTTLDACKFVLQLYTSHAKTLSSEYTVEAKIAYDSWTNGTGFENSSPSVTDGVSWQYPSSGSSWSTSGDITTSLKITGSLGGSWLYQSGSGSYDLTHYDQSFYTQPGLEEQESFSYRPTDINMDVTDAVKLWINGSAGTTISNNGFLLKFSDADETSGGTTGYVRFFSRETHTIYVPKLTMYWDQSAYSSTLDALDLESNIIYPKINKSYKDTEIARIRLYGRDKYPQKSATNLFPLQAVKRLPETTYYSVIDAATDETIIPFDDIYTKVSCDATSNFIYLDMNGLMPERYYRIALKIVDGFTEQYHDNEYYFKVVR